MKIIRKIVLSSLVIVVLMTFFLTGCSDSVAEQIPSGSEQTVSSDTSVGGPESATEPNDQTDTKKDKDLPAFSVSDLKILQETVKPRENSGASVIVSNNSDQPGDFTVELKIDGTVIDHRDVSLPAKSNETVTFKFSREEIGTYTVEIGHLSAKFTVSTGVLEPEGTDETPTETFVTPPSAQPDWTIPEGTGDLYRAIHMGGNWGTNTNAVSDPPEEYFEYLRDLNVNWVGISTSLHVNGSMDSTVEFVYDGVPQASWTDATFRNLIQAFKRHGFNIYVHVAFENTWTGDNGFDRWQMGDPFMHAQDPDIDAATWPWRTDHPQHAEFVAEFWRTYTDCLVHIADICEDEGVGMLTLGTETDRLFRSRTGGQWPNNYLAEMQTMVSEVRNVYSGLLSYEMLHFTLEDRDLFGPANDYLYQDLDLDFLALSAYFKLSQAAQNRVMGTQELEAAWEHVYSEYVIPWQQRNPGKPIVFTEFGYTDVTECPWDPSGRQFVDKIMEDRDNNGLDDGEEAQRNCIDAFFNVMENHPGVVDGAFVWGLEMATQEEYDSSFGQMRSFSVRDKLAEETVRDRYGEWLNQ